VGATTGSQPQTSSRATESEKAKGTLQTVFQQPETSQRDLDERVITEALNRGVDHLDPYQKSAVLMTRVLCLFLPKESETAGRLRAGTVALLKDPSSLKAAEALYILAKSAVPSADRSIGTALRRNRQASCQPDLQFAKDLINISPLSTDPAVWKTVLSKCEPLVLR